MDEAEEYLVKALENLAGAASEFSAQRFNSCSRAAYYGCFPAAVAAFMRAGVWLQQEAVAWGMIVFKRVLSVI